MRHYEKVSLQQLFKVGKANVDAEVIPKNNSSLTSERGFRPTPESRMKYFSRLMWVDGSFRSCIVDIRSMDRTDPRCKRIHRKTATTMTKSGLTLSMPNENKRVQKTWNDFYQRLKLGRREKLISDARGYLMEGNLMMQWVLGADNKLHQGIRMPSETMMANVNENGVFKDLQSAYVQIDVNTGQPATNFALWQISHGRLDPDNYDDYGSLGRPLLDANRTIWRKLTMTDEDLVIRRRDRAPLQKAHILEGATPEELQQYQDDVEMRRRENPVDTDYFLSKAGGVQALQGDENLDQVNDIMYLVDTFFTGAPAPKGLFGYADNLNRDILEDLKRDFFEEVDSMQDELAGVYQSGFELELLLNGIDPRQHSPVVKFKERVTETLNQAADRALKQQAAGCSSTTTWETMGIDPVQEIERKKKEAQSSDPYPDPNNIGGQDVTITPGNAGKGESATDVSND